jgi:putative transposase
VTIKHDALGWHVTFAYEIEHAAPINVRPAVGIDRGVVNTLTLSTGERLSVPASLEAIERRYCAAQRIVSRRKKGSNRRRAAVRRVARLSAKRARIRRHWQHKTALDISTRFGTAVLEDLRIMNMTASARGTLEEPGRMVRQKAGLNRSILNQGWFDFENILAYKLEERGGRLLKVDPAYTSQTCSDCGAVDSESRENQASFNCCRCGFRAHADHNAAINILRRNTASMRMEEGHRLSGEVRTGSRFTPAENPPTGRC